MIRRLLRLVVAVALLAALVLVAGGYYYATQINAEGLRVDPAAPERDVTVVRVSASSITLREKGERDDELRTSGTYGVRWPTGFGQVTGEPGEGREVTRPFRLLSGRLPGPGEAVGVTDDAFPDDPAEALGRPAREVLVSSSGGDFPAWWVRGTGPTWVVLVHGKGASRTEVLRMMRVPVRLGVSALAITYRNDAMLPLDESRRYAYGRTEWQELEAAVTWAKQQGAGRVVLAGASMGGAIIASFLERSDQTGVVSGLVLDSPLLSFEEAVDHGAARRGIPGLGWDLPEPLTWTAKRFASLRYGVDWRAVDYLDDTSWLDVPTLLFHGTEDGRVSYANSARLAEEKDGFVTFETADGAEHTESWNHDPAAYESALGRFLVGLTRR